MSALEAFLANPWASSHSSYEESAFHMRPAPEFATAEVVVASTYRAVGFEGHSEGAVPAMGRQLDKASPRAVRSNGTSRIDPDTWRTILHGALESPKQPNQSARRFLQLCPIVPDVALYSGSARLSGNSWNPGQLVERMIRLGSASTVEAGVLWNALHDGLSVGEGDDVWARWLQGEFEGRRIPQVEWQLRVLKDAPPPPDPARAVLRIPARQFTQDLAAVLRSKPCMTRRQWVSLLEATLRLGTVGHVLWLCGVNDRLWRMTRSILAGAEVAPPADVVAKTVIEGASQHLVYGMPALPIVRDLASRYLAARLGINLVLLELEQRGIQLPSLDSAAGLADFLAVVQAHRTTLHEADVLGKLADLRDRQARTVACKRGIGSNIVEFCRHALGQRQAADENLRGYDQGYYLKKRGEYAAAPWIVSLGPVALLALVHCCLEEAAGPRSVQRLCEHLTWYGVDVDRDDVAKSDLGRKLRMLGLVLDSPDAESGMLLVPPFDLPGIPSGGQAE